MHILRWRFYASIILVTAVFGARPALAQDATETPYPRTRPVETDSLGKKESEVPGAIPNLFSTVDAKAEADAKAQVGLALIQAAVEAELNSAAKQAAVSTAEAASKAWEKQVGVITSDAKLVRQALQTAEKALADFKAKITPQSTIFERAKIADLQVKVASAKMYVEQFNYHGADQGQMAATARRVLQENRWFAAQAALKAVLARQKAMPYSAQFIVTEAQVTEAKAQLARAQLAMAGGTNLASYKPLKEKASALYSRYKDEHTAAVELVFNIQKLIAAKIKADQDAGATKAGITAATNELAAAETAMKALTSANATVQRVADARLSVLQARRKVGDAKVAAFPLYLKAKDANLAAERVIAPLTEALAQTFITAAQGYEKSVNDWISSSSAYAETAAAQAKTAAARATAIRTAGAALDEAQGLIEGLKSELAQAKAAEGPAQAALDALRVGQNGPTEIAAAQAAVAAAKAKTAAADLKLAQAVLQVAQAKVNLAQAIAQTEAELLAIYPLQFPDQSAAAAGEKLTAEGEVTVKEMTAQNSQTLSETAKARSNTVNAKTAEMQAAQKEYNRLYKEAYADQQAYEQSKKDLVTNMTETPGPLTLINNRLRVGAALITAQKGWLQAARQFAALALARQEIARAAFATEAAVSALSGKTGRYIDPGTASPVAGGANKAVEMWEGALNRTKTAVELGEAFKTEVAKLTANLNGSKDAVTAMIEKVAKRQADIARVEKEYAEMLAAGKGGETLADKKVDLDGLKVDLAEAIAKQAALELKVEEVNLERDTLEALIDPRIVSLYPYARPDLRAEDQAKVTAAKANAAAKESDIKWAEQALNYSLYMIDEIIISEQSLDTAEAARKKAQDEVKASEEAKATALEKSQGLLSTAKDSLTEIAARVLPRVFSDSRIDSYIQTRKAQAAAKITNDLDLAAANNKQINARWATARTDTELTKDAIALAEAKLDEARARYAIEAAHPNAKERDETAAALAAKETAEESLTAAHRAYEESYSELIATLNEAVLVKQAYLAALKNAGEEKGAVYADIDQTIAGIQGDIVEAAKTKEGVTARRVKREEAEAAAKAELEEAIANGWVRKEVPLSLLVKQKMKELVGQNCTKNDTDPVKCLVCNTVMEMRVDESMEGKLLPGRTVMIRYYKDLDFYSGGKNSVCGIVWKPGQYSWTTENKDRHIVKTDTDEVRASLIAYYESEMPYPEPLTHYLSPGAMTQGNPPWWYTCNNDMQYDIGVNVACYDTSGRNYEFNETKYSKEARKRARSIKLSKESYESLLPPMPVARKRK